MKTIPFDYGQRTLHLYFNGSAMFAIDELNAERGDDKSGALDLMQEQTADGFSMLVRVAVILAEQGELCRRYLHHAPERIPTEKELLLLLSPMQMLSLKTTVIQALNDGWSNADSGEDDDIDLGLLELEKKTKL